MKVYQIDFSKLVVLLLPIRLRKSRIYAFLVAFTRPLVYLRSQLTTFRADANYRLTYNGQVRKLRKVLNDAFPEAEGSIDIEDGEAIGVWQYSWDEDYDPYRLYLLADDANPALFWDQDTILEGLSNFVVKVPASLNTVNNTAKLRALLNYYKLVSKSYSIVYE
jgi:hypothetical protein